MLKRRVSLLRFLCILGQEGVLEELGGLLTDQSDRHNVKEYLLNTWVLFLVTFYISLSTLYYQQLKLHALSPLAASGGSWYYYEKSDKLLTTCLVDL